MVCFCGFPQKIIVSINIDRKQVEFARHVVLSKNLDDINSIYVSVSDRDLAIAESNLKCVRITIVTLDNETVPVIVGDQQRRITLAPVFNADLDEISSMWNTRKNFSQDTVFTVLRGDARLECVQIKLLSARAAESAAFERFENAIFCSESVDQQLR